MRLSLCPSNSSNSDFICIIVYASINSSTWNPLIWNMIFFYLQRKTCKTLTSVYYNESRFTALIRSSSRAWTRNEFYSFIAVKRFFKAVKLRSLIILLSTHSNIYRMITYSLFVRPSRGHRVDVRFVHFASAADDLLPNSTRLLIGRRYFVGRRFLTRWSIIGSWRCGGVIRLQKGFYLGAQCEEIVHAQDAIWQVVIDKSLEVVEMGGVGERRRRKQAIVERCHSAEALRLLFPFYVALPETIWPVFFFYIQLLYYS